jgi:hypothetical protein
MTPMLLPLLAALLALSLPAARAARFQVMGHHDEYQVTMLLQWNIQ